MIPVGSTFQNDKKSALKKGRTCFYAHMFRMVKKLTKEIINFYCRIMEKQKHNWFEKVQGQFKFKSAKYYIRDN